MPGISAETAGARAIHLQFVTLPPGAKAKAHKHEAHETAIYVLSGVSGMWYGQQLEQHMEVKAGDFLHIPADMPHLPYNPSATEDGVAIIARTDPTNRKASFCCRTWRARTVCRRPANRAVCESRLPTASV